MRLRSHQAIPDHIRRAVRLSTAILVLSSVGFSLVGRPGCQKYVLLIKWALLTCPVVTMPLLGKVRSCVAGHRWCAPGFLRAARTSHSHAPVLPPADRLVLLLPAPQTSQVSFERALGTVVGGGLGFLATAAATRWWTLQATETDDIFLAALAAAAAFASVLAGQRFSLDLSAKLFVIAFILVCFSSQEGRGVCWPCSCSRSRRCSVAHRWLACRCWLGLPACLCVPSVHADPSLHCSRSLQ